MPNDEWVQAGAAALCKARARVNECQDVAREHVCPWCREGAAAVLAEFRRLLDRDGWQVVPKVAHWPREMNVAFCAAVNEWKTGTDEMTIPDDIMRPALAAAPSPWGGSDE